jgi:hypothetical protein
VRWWVFISFSRYRCPTTWIFIGQHHAHSLIQLPLSPRTRPRHIRWIIGTISLDFASKQIRHWMTRSWYAFSMLRIEFDANVFLSTFWDHCSQFNRVQPLYQHFHWSCGICQWNGLSRGFSFDWIVLGRAYRLTRRCVNDWIYIWIAFQVKAEP